VFGIVLNDIHVTNQPLKVDLEGNEFSILLSEEMFPATIIHAYPFSPISSSYPAIVITGI
jgi:hypothetical protein